MLNFAFIGCGNISRFHADVISALGHRISSVSAREDSSNIVKFSRDYNVDNTYASWKEMLRIEKPDAIVVAVSWDQTEQIVEDIIKTRIPCLVEKPVALTSKRLRQIISVSKKFNNNVFVGYNRRFYDFIPLLKKTINSQELISIELNFPEALDSIVKIHTSKIIEHMLLYMTSHWLDLLIYLIGDVKIEHICCGRNKADHLFRAYNGILSSLKHNVPIHLQINFNAPSQTSMTFNFREEIYKLCPIELLTVYKGMDIINASNAVKIRTYLPKVHKTYEIDAAYKPGFYSQMENFIETCVRNSRTNEIGCTLEDALKVTKLCEQIKGKT